jgi:hypothetical protein
LLLSTQHNTTMNKCSIVTLCMSRLLSLSLFIFNSHYIQYTDELIQNQQKERERGRMSSQHIFIIWLCWVNLMFHTLTHSHTHTLTHSHTHTLTHSHTHTLTHSHTHTQSIQLICVSTFLF